MSFPAESQFQNYMADVRSRIPASSRVMIGEESLWFALADNCKIWDMGVPDGDQATKVRLDTGLRTITRNCRPKMRQKKGNRR